MSKQASGDSLPDAIGAGKPKRVARLLAQGMSANSADAAGRPVLLLAARAGNLNAVRQLIAAGADVDGRTSDGITAVVVATRCSQYGVVKALVDKGAHVDIVDFQGKTVLDHAMETRRSSARHSFGITQWRIKRLLLQHGAKSGYPYAEPEKLAQLVTDVGQGDAFLDWRATPAGWSGWQLLARSVPIATVWAVVWWVDIEWIWPLLVAWLMVDHKMVTLRFSIAVAFSAMRACVQRASAGTDRKRTSPSSSATARPAAPASTPAPSTPSIAGADALTDIRFISDALLTRSGALLRGGGSAEATLAPAARLSHGASILIGLVQLGCQCMLVLTAAVSLGWLDVSSAVWPSDTMQRATAASALALVMWSTLWLEVRLRWYRLLLAQRQVDAHAAAIGSMATADLTQVGSQAAVAVYLRPFVTTRRIPLGRLDLETLLAYTLAPVMPVVALGRPGDHVGAGLITTSEDQWQLQVITLLKKASAIFCIPSARSGTFWELQQLRDMQLLPHTVFLMPLDFELPPDSRPYGKRFSQEWSALQQKALTLGLTFPPFQHQGGLFKLDPSGRVEMLTGLTIDPLLIGIAQASGGFRHSDSGFDSEGRGDDGDTAFPAELDPPGHGSDHGSSDDGD